MPRRGSCSGGRCYDSSSDDCYACSPKTKRTAAKKSIAKRVYKPKKKTTSRRARDSSSCSCSDCDDCIQCPSPPRRRASRGSCGSRGGCY